MGAIESLKPTFGYLKNGLSHVATYAWILIPLVIIASIFAIFFIIKKIRDKKRQWTHQLYVRKVINSKGELSDEIIHNMRRFAPRPNVFELEKPLLGGWLFPEPAEMQGLNKYKIVIDKNNRIYLNQGEYFSPAKDSINVSATHAEIDIQRRNFNEAWQRAHKVEKRLEWGQIMKYAFMALGIICLTIMGIVGLQKWGEAHQADAEKAKAEAQIMNTLADALETMEATVNTQNIMIPKLKELIGTNNLQGIINSEKVVKNETGA